MIKKIFFLIASMGLAFNLSGCTSKENKVEGEETVATSDAADLEKVESDFPAEMADATAPSDQLSEEALGESQPVDVAAENIESAVNTAESLPEDPLAEKPLESSNENIASEQKASELVTEAPKPEVPATDLSSLSENSPSTTVVDSEPAPKPNKALQKIAAAPWKVGKTWFNAVYFARPGETLAGISQMIYGADKTALLKKGNGTFNSRDVKPGDKVYYNSPVRPEDGEKMLTYYEDNGMAPESYVAKPGDNLRKVAKALLGYPNAWKEVWAMNAIESKDNLSEGTELRYWKGSTSAATVAQVSPPLEAKSELPPPPAFPEPSQEKMPEPPPVQSINELPPQPTPQAELPPPPPPPPQDVANELPPPPPPMMAANKKKPKVPTVEIDAANEAGQDTTMALAAVALAAVGLGALFVIKKKKRQRELEQQSMDQTHVGT